MLTEWAAFAVDPYVDAHVITICQKLGSEAVWPLFSCEGSPTATKAVILQAQAMSGRYRDDYLMSKWHGATDCCRLPNCGFYPGDLVHFLSGSCPALRDALSNTLQHSLDGLTNTPYLIPPIVSAKSHPRRNVPSSS